MSSYLPEKTFVVCTMQMSPTKGQLLADPDKRDISVLHSKKDVALLTKDDLMLMNDFGCQQKWQGPVTSAGFWGGFAAGLAIAVFSVATFGVGAAIIGACAIAAAVYTYAAVKSNSKKCNPQLNAWQNPHPTVKFNQVSAVTQTSFMTCNAGGMLQPFISPSAANAAAKRVAWANRGEIALTGVISFMFGAATGYAGGAAYGALRGAGGSLMSSVGSGFLAGGKEVGIGMLGAYLIYAPLSYGEKKGIRNLYKSDNGNTAYDRMIANRENTEAKDWFEFEPGSIEIPEYDLENLNISELEAPRVKAPKVNDFGYDSADDDYNPNGFRGASSKTFDRSVELFRINQNDAYIERMMNVEGTKAEKQAAIEAIAKEMGKTKSGAEAVQNMRRKGSGEIIIRNKTQNKGNRVTTAHRNNARAARAEAIWGTKNKGYTNGMAYNGIALLLPLVVTPLDEYTIVWVSQFAEQDIANGNSVSSTSH
ncbi:hypothetical protein [uncultured Aquimarina sp.]|uniref:hypothetical protein n=1 Tax=uncultured Aquimarina sp. TaxID=575652 RepID=UPI0026212092|nr:hypothetical protein [uncultured Aquimarina sp.]